MATYLDIYGAVKRGIRYKEDLATELYESEVLIRTATDTLCQIGILKITQREGVDRIDVQPDVLNQASAEKKAKAAGLDLSVEVAGSRPRISLFPTRRSDQKKGR